MTNIIVSDVKDFHYVQQSLWQLVASAESGRQQHKQGKQQASEKHSLRFCLHMKLNHFSYTSTVKAVQTPLLQYRYNYTSMKVFIQVQLIPVWNIFCLKKNSHPQPEQLYPYKNCIQTRSNSYGNVQRQILLLYIRPSALFYALQPTHAGFGNLGKHLFHETYTQLSLKQCNLHL